MGKEYTEARQKNAEDVPVVRSVWQDIYARRKETIERAFADAKEKHAMRYTYSEV